MGKLARLLQRDVFRAPVVPSAPSCVGDVDIALQRLQKDGCQLLPDPQRVAYQVSLGGFEPALSSLASYVWDLLSTGNPPEPAPVVDVVPDFDSPKKKFRATRNKKLPAVKKKGKRNDSPSSPLLPDPPPQRAVPKERKIPEGYCTIESLGHSLQPFAAEGVKSVYLQKVVWGTPGVVDAPPALPSESELESEQLSCVWRAKIHAAKEAAALKASGGSELGAGSAPHRWAYAYARVHNMEHAVRREVRSYIFQEMLRTTVPYATKLLRTHLTSESIPEVHEKLGCKFIVSARGSRGVAITGSRRSFGKLLKQELHGAELLHRVDTALCAPPSYCMDFLGMRVLVVAAVPSGDGDVIYGSNEISLERATAADEVSGGDDANHPHPVIKASSCVARVEMERLSRALKLAGHWVERRHRRRFLYTPIDLQIQRDRDGTLYAVNLRRLVPPFATSLTQHHMLFTKCPFYLISRFSVEAMQHLKNPVSSDAFSPFGAHRGEIHDKTAVAEAQCMEEQCIREVLRVLEKATEGVKWWREPKEMEEVLDAEKSVQIAEPERMLSDDMRAVSCFCGGIAEVFRANGLNLRYLGILASKVQNEGLRLALLVELTARVVKHLSFFRDDPDTASALSKFPAKHFPSISAVIRDTIVTSITKHDSAFFAMCTQLFPGCPPFDASELPEVPVISAIGRVCGLMFQNTASGEWCCSARWCDVGTIACREVVRLPRFVCGAKKQADLQLLSQEVRQQIEHEKSISKRLLLGGAAHASSAWGDDVSLSTIMFVKRKLCTQTAQSRRFRYISSFGKCMSLDPTPEVMKPFRMHHGMVVQFESKLCATVLGVYDGKIWRHDDTTQGARAFSGSTYREVMSATPFVWVADVLPMPLRTKPYIAKRQTVLQEHHHTQLGPLGILQRFASSQYLVKKYGYQIGDRLQYTRGEHEGKMTVYLGCFCGVAWTHDNDGSFPHPLAGDSYTELQEAYGFRLLFNKAMPSHPESLLQYGARQMRCAFRVMHKYGVHHSQVVKFEGIQKQDLEGKEGVVYGIDDGQIWVSLRCGKGEVIGVDARYATHMKVVGTVCLPVRLPPEVEVFPYPTLPHGEVGGFDIRCSTCRPFGIYHAQRYKVIRGEHLRQLGTVVGVWEGRIWGQLDGARGAEAINPADLVVLSISTKAVKVVPAAVPKQWKLLQDTVYVAAPVLRGRGFVSSSSKKKDDELQDPDDTSDSSSEDLEETEEKGKPLNSTHCLSVTGEVLLLDTSHEACAKFGYFSGQRLEVAGKCIPDYPPRQFLCRGATAGIVSQGKSSPRSSQAGSEDTVIVIIGVACGELWFARDSKALKGIPPKCEPLAGRSRRCIDAAYAPRVVGLAEEVSEFYDPLKHRNTSVFQTITHASFSLGGAEYHRTTKKQNVLVDVTEKSLAALTGGKGFQLSMIISRERVPTVDPTAAPPRPHTDPNTPPPLDKESAVRIVGCTAEGMWVQQVGPSSTVSLVTLKDIPFWHPNIAANLKAIPVKDTEKTADDLAREACLCTFPEHFCRSWLKPTAHVWEYYTFPSSHEDDTIREEEDGEEEVKQKEWVRFEKWQVIDEAYEQQKPTVRVDEAALQATLTVYFPGLLCILDEVREYRIRRRAVISVTSFASLAYSFAQPIDETLSGSPREHWNWHNLLATKTTERFSGRPEMCLHRGSDDDAMQIPCFHYDDLSLVAPVVLGVKRVFTTAVLSSLHASPIPATTRVDNCLHAFPTSCRPLVCVWMLYTVGVVTDCDVVAVSSTPLPYPHLAGLWASYEAYTGKIIQVPRVQEFGRFVGAVLWVHQNVESRARRKVLRDQKKLRGVLFGVLEKKLAVVLSRQQGDGEGGWPPIGELLKAEICESLEELAVVALRAKEKRDGQDDRGHVLEEIDKPDTNAVLALHQDWKCGESMWLIK